MAAGRPVKPLMLPKGCARCLSSTNQCGQAPCPGSGQGLRDQLKTGVCLAAYLSRTQIRRLKPMPKALIGLGIRPRTTGSIHLQSIWTWGGSRSRPADGASHHFRMGVVSGLATGPRRDSCGASAGPAAPRRCELHGDQTTGQPTPAAATGSTPGRAIPWGHHRQARPRCRGWLARVSSIDPERVPSEISDAAPASAPMDFNAHLSGRRSESGRCSKKPVGIVTGSEP
jgi:hypothetical protein